MNIISYLCNMKTIKTTIMKKIVLFLLATLPAMTGWSQDTATSFRRDIYYINPFPDTLQDYVMKRISVTGTRCGIQTKEMYLQSPEKPIKIYGVAAAMMTSRDLFYIPPDDPTVDSAEWWADFFHYHCTDTSTDNTYEYLGIYTRSGQDLVAQREVMVHRKYDTPAFYVSTGKSLFGFPNFVYPMYEKYFDSSIVVDGTFYVGVTQLTGWAWMAIPPYLTFWTLAYTTSSYDYNEYHVWKYCYPEDTSWYWPYPENRGDEYYLIFPILTPDPDNPDPIDPSDTTAVNSADLVSRYVTVSPNPATDRVQVLSSFGLTHLEAYDADGRRVAEREASGLEDTLDVTAWPRGTYLLRITTPVGTVTKKLLVQ